MTVRIGWIGFHQEGIEALTAILEAGYLLDVVITLDKDTRAKRSADVDYDPICSSFGVTLYKIKNINEPKVVSLLQELNLDVVFVIGWSQIINNEALAAVKVGMIGAHASLLPKNRGSAPINWSIINGEMETGNTLIWLSEEVDEGDIIAHRKFPITDFDSCESLYRKVANSNREMILEIIPKILAGEKPGYSQIVNNFPVLSRRHPKDGIINWDSSARNIYNFIRAITYPYPGAFSYINGRCWKIWSAALLPFKSTNSNPGEVIDIVVSPEEKACGLVVSCVTGFLLLLEIESEDGYKIFGYELANTQWIGKIFGAK